MPLSKTTACVTLVLLALTLPAAAGSRIVEFDAPGRNFVVPGNAIDAKGQSIGFYFDTARNLESSFIRSKSGALAIVAPGSGNPLVAHAIAGPGLVTGLFETGGDAPEGFVTDAAGDLTRFTVPGANMDAFGTQPSAINASGMVTGFYSPSGQEYARGFVRDPQGNLTLFDGPDADTVEGGTFPTAINEGGDVVGTTQNGDTVSAFVRKANGKAKLVRVPKGSLYSLAVGINRSGAIAGIYTLAGNDTYGYLCDKAGALTSFKVNGSHPTVSGVNDGGSIVGWIFDTNAAAHSFVRAPGGGIKMFDAPGAGIAQGQGTFATSINSKGMIAGYYVTADKVHHGFIRRP